MKHLFRNVLIGVSIAAIAFEVVQVQAAGSFLDVQQDTMNFGIIPLDGRGNNISHPEWGSVNQNFLRLTPADYGDGVSTPAGADRPSARTISNTFSPNSQDGILNDRDYTAFVYAWGQFLDHDIDLTDSASPKEALMVIVPAGDEWFDPTGTGTMVIPLSRSNYDPASSPREQINSITAFVDGSQVYGVDAERAAALRTFTGGQMKVSAGNLLPLNTQGLPNANDAHRVDDAQLYLAGDVRANENPELVSLHVLFVREHNRIASEAAQQHPNWTDEELYQYARRIVIAELQHITYAEFLPALLGSNALPRYSGYKEDVNPGIANEFATGAFRLGHSMLGSDIEFLDNDGEEVRDAMELRDSFFNPLVLSDTDIDPLLKYLASDNAQEIDTVAVDDVRNFLFGEPGQGGFDLVSLNIQRGRDHGLADYNTTREAYGLSRVTRFDQITSDPAMQAKLASTYGSVNNIDLWIGGLAEDHLPGSSVGETFSAILVDQFVRLRDGDRYWYELSLPRDLVNEINDTSLADIIRRNTDITKLQENVFFFNESTVIIDTSSTTRAQVQGQSTLSTQDEEEGEQEQRGNPPPPPPRPNDRPPRNGNGRGGGGRGRP